MNDSNEPLNEIKQHKLSKKYTDRIAFFGWCLSSIVKKENSEYWVSALIVHFGVLKTLKIMREAKFKGIFKNIPEKHLNTDDLIKYLKISECNTKKSKTNADKRIDMTIYFKVIESNKSTIKREKISIADKVYSKLEKRINEDHSVVYLIDSLKDDLVSGNDIDPYKYV